MRLEEIQTLQALGMPLKEIQGLAKSWQGTSFAVPTAGFRGNLELTGTAKIFLGLRFADISTTPTGATCNIKLNNEVLYNNVDVLVPDVALGNISTEYIDTMRKLTGKDILEIEFLNVVNGGTIRVIVAYLN